MAKHRSRHKQTNKSMFKLDIGKHFFNVVREAAAPLSFWDQISAKDRQDLGSAWDNAPLMQKGKIAVNIIGGRMFGIHAFKDEHAPPQTFNLNGVFNKWTSAGALGMLYSKIPIKQLPMKGKIGVIAKRLLTGGVVGGIFDDPVDQSLGTRSVNPTRNIVNYSSQPTRQIMTYTPRSSGVQTQGAFG